jgi:tetratricopeptide (TPR) repeat protein
MSEESSGTWGQISDAVTSKPILLGLVLVLFTIVLYSPVSHHGFLRWDDNLYVTENPHVTTGVTVDNVRWALTENGTFYWHPVTWFSHMLDCQFFGLNPGSHHIINLLLHGANVLLLFLLLQQSTRAFWRSFLVAALFALHPLNIETVAWLSERKSLLCAFFSLLTFIMYGWYAKRPSLKRYVAVLFTFVLALMAKPMAVTIPLLLLLWDYWPIERTGSWLRLGREKLPMLACSLGSSLLTVIGQRAAGALSSTTRIPVGMRFEQAIICYIVYLRKLFLPTDLAPYYPYHPHWIEPIQVVIALVFLAALAGLAIRFRHVRYLLVGWLFFLIGLLPVLGIVQVGRVVIADRFTYIPAIGIFLMVVWGCGELVQAHTIARIIPTVASVAIGVGLVVISVQDLQYWQSGTSLFTHTAQVVRSPDSMLEDMIGDAYIADGRTDEALEHYRRSCALEPHFDLCNYNIGAIMFTRYNATEALTHFQIAGRYTTHANIALQSLVGSGRALMNLGDPAGAERQFSYALSIDPENSEAKRMISQIRANR